MASIIQISGPRAGAPNGILQSGSFEVGGYDAVKAMKDIARSCEEAVLAGATFFSVTADQDRMLRLTMAKCPAKDRKDPELAVLSSLGMTVQMSNFEAGCLCVHMDAIQNSSTNKPTLPALPPAQPEEHETASATN